MVIEWSHRWLAALVGILAIATAVSVWRHFRDTRSAVIPAITAVVVIGIQAWVGRLVVKGDLDADLVSLHLAISMTVVALQTIVVVATLPATDPARIRNRRWQLQVGSAAVASFLLLLLGSLVHNRYFPGWPLMENSLVPDLTSSLAVAHFLHRMLAALLLIYLFYLVAVANRIDLPSMDRRLIRSAAVVYSVNVGLGAAHVFTMVSSAFLVAAHLGLAGLVWSLLVAATTLSTTTQRAQVPA
jgi:cytochrome c oxidase assembly protein subunit 15